MPDVTITINTDEWAVVPRPDSRDWLDWVHAISDAIEESEYYVEPLLRSFLDHAPQPEQAQLSDDVLAAALDNLVHDNYERSQCGSKNRQADADLIRAALARAQQPAPRPVQANVQALVDALNDALEYLQHHLPDEAIAPHRAALAAFEQGDSQ